MKTPEKSPFASALLLVRNEDVAVIDRRVLRDAGVRSVQVLCSGVQAARMLAEAVAMPESRKGPDMVLCHEQLGDMTGDEFVRLIRLHPALVPFPVIMTVTADTPAIRTRARESGYSGLLVRPYPASALAAQLRLAAESEKATRAALGRRLEAPPTTFLTALSALARQVLMRSVNPEQIYRGALHAIRQQHWDEAIPALQRAIKLAPENGDMLLALAAAWHGKNNLEKSRALLREAVAVFVDNRAWDRAAGVSERLLHEAPGEPHPLQAEARRLLAGGHVEDAVTALLRSGFRGAHAAAGPEGKRAWVYEQVARGCMMSASPADTLERLKARLVAAGERDCALALETYVLSRLAGAESAVVLRNRHAALPPVSAGPAFAGEMGREQELPTPRTGDDKSGTPHVRDEHAGDPQLRDGEEAPVIPLLREPATSTALRGFPLLRDAVNVARVTMGLMRAERKARRNRR